VSNRLRRSKLQHPVASSFAFNFLRIIFSVLACFIDFFLFSMCFWFDYLKFLLCLAKISAETGAGESSQCQHDV